MIEYKVIKKLSIAIFFVQSVLGVYSQSAYISLSPVELKDKIMGGWAGQTIGVTFGGPYEFRFPGTFIGDYQPLEWSENYLRETMLNNPGLYDDLYMDLTFVDVIERNGVDAPIDSFANSFAHAGYELWHANQAARYNILQGIPAPLSGHWKNNPHADDIDYQIESDFAGLMSPGMPNAASEISDKVGHIMNYGDGWYGGVFTGAMYAFAFVSSDIETIISQALKTVPVQSQFYGCIKDVLGSYRKDANDWKQAWFLVQKKWADETGCPDGVFAPFNIDAKVNAAYVVIGLLYGQGDFTKTLEIATRCGQDADCNPSTAGGILGTMLGYHKIPDYWKRGLMRIENISFKYTTLSLNKVYELSYQHALKAIERNGGKVSAGKIIIKVQQPSAVKFEKSFEGLYPVNKISTDWSVNKGEAEFTFNGTGFVMKGDVVDWPDKSSTHVYEGLLYIDDKFAEAVKMPASLNGRRYDLCWKYDLPKTSHHVLFKVLNLSAGKYFKLNDVIVYSDRPVFYDQK